MRSATFRFPVLMALTVAATAAGLVAQPGPPPLPAGRVQLGPLKNGARDFDFLFGTWKATNTRAYSSAGADQSNQIADARVTVRAVAGGHVVLEYEVVRGDSVRLSGIEVMLYDPKSRQWAVHDTRIDSAVLEQPAYGHFEGDSGRFFAERELSGRRVPVRISWRMRGLDEATWTWAFSIDGGATWNTHWSLHLVRTGPAPGEPLPTLPNDAAASVAPGANRRIRSCCYVVESFRYVVPPGKERILTRLFNDEASLLGDSGYVHDIALMRDIDRPNMYVWFRGFDTDDVVRKFFYSPVWTAHRETLGREGIRIDSAYSFHPGLYTQGFTVGERLTPRAAETSAGLVVATLHTFQASQFQGSLWVPSLVPVMAAAGGRPLALFETFGWALEPPSATGDRTLGVPGRGPPTGSRTVALFTWVSDVPAYERYVTALNRDPQYRDVIAPIVERSLGAPIVVWRLAPLAGSRAFRWSWER